MLGKIAAIIVTYNIDVKIIKYVANVVQQVDKVFIIDNYSCKQTLMYLKYIKKAFKNVVIIYNKENVGLAKAQNIGIKEAIKENFDWVLLLDHDSYLTNNFIKVFQNYYDSLSFLEKQKVSILAPRIYDLNINVFYSHLIKKGFFFKRVSCSKAQIIRQVLFVIASGSLIKIESIQKLGLFREDFFIDFIDVEYCLRSIKHGYEIHVVCDAILLHQLGNRKLYKICGFTFKPTFHSPERKYYIYRNRKIVWKMYLKTVPTFVIYDILACCLDIIRVILFEDMKLKKLLMSFKGFLDK